ncbi:uncharacterized membrane protein YcaP (DUF421 family) [Oikeobacillus pervagus]|uniref:Uncharacterized membrane protein YcaP (DUF421 family) n=1 Tax=Oikeobacillus pervagus TaxID=1325931 RepID=A0AAJ1WI39_9BACI|nr:DUF421 domain-containing protein [Oikeobacillus pervagus]MDQ0213993.1 uncharacterized membrane protein YcaP (DUF421 family) [Oikeobacillus pervagus]
MDFFLSQDSLTAIQWILRAIVGFFFLIIITKIMGQRSISQLRFLDFVMALIIGNIIAHPLSDEKLGLKGSMITTTVLVVLYVFAVLLSLRWVAIRKFFDPSPITLVENGKVKYENLMKARITIDLLLSEIRREKIEDLQKIALAIWEPGGKISIFLDPKHLPLTATDLSFAKKPFHLPKIIIKERKIMYDELQKLGKDESWVLKEIEHTYATKLEDVLIATIDQNEQFHIVLYDNDKCIYR